MENESFEGLVKITGYLFSTYYRCKLNDLDWEHNEFIMMIDDALHQLETKDYNIICEEFLLKQGQVTWNKEGSKSTYYRTRRRAMTHFLHCLTTRNVI